MLKSFYSQLRGPMEFPARVNDSDISMLQTKLAKLHVLSCREDRHLQKFHYSLMKVMYIYISLPQSRQLLSYFTIEYLELFKPSVMMKTTISRVPYLNGNEECYGSTTIVLTIFCLRCWQIRVLQRQDHPSSSDYSTSMGYCGS